ncbi:MAG: hypothetical protein IPK08_11355 [Bacteroidetes bacterium]|nr:hypothetical protein [Bacteroidota bacterium]
MNQSLTYIDSEIINNFGRREVAHTVAVFSKANGTDVFIAGSITNTGNALRDLYIFKLKTDLTQGANPSHVILEIQVPYPMKLRTK